MLQFRERFLKTSSLSPLNPRPFHLCQIKSNCFGAKLISLYFLIKISKESLESLRTLPVCRDDQEKFFHLNAEGSLRWTKVGITWKNGRRSGRAMRDRMPQGRWSVWRCLDNSLHGRAHLLIPKTGMTYQTFDIGLSAAYPKW